MFRCDVTPRSWVLVVSNAKDKQLKSIKFKTFLIKINQIKINQI